MDQVGAMEDVAIRSSPSTGWQRLLVEPRRPERIRSRPGAFWLAVAAVCIGAFMGQLDSSIVTVAPRPVTGSSTGCEPVASVRRPSGE